MEEVRIADLCFSSTVVAAIAEDPIDHDDDLYIIGAVRPSQTSLFLPRWLVRATHVPLFHSVFLSWLDRERWQQFIINLNEISAFNYNREIDSE